MQYVCVRQFTLFGTAVSGRASEDTVCCSALQCVAV